MAIVKGNYTKSKAKIKASIRYLLHRPNQKGERTTRALFNQEGLIDKESAYRLIDGAPRGTYFFRLVISPDSLREDSKRDLNLQTITKQAILSWEKRRGRRIQFIAVEHNDHSPHRHIHAIALLRLNRKERISVKDYRVIRETATRAARFERRFAGFKTGLPPGKAFSPKGNRHGRGTS